MIVTRCLRLACCLPALMGAGGTFAQTPGQPMQPGPPELVQPQRMPRPEPVTPFSGVDILRPERPFTPQSSPIRRIPRKQRFEATPPGASLQSPGAGPLMPGRGFTMTMTGESAGSDLPSDLDVTADPDSHASLQRPRDVARRLRMCWQAPASPDKQEITVRLAFNRDGSVLGTPRITYIQRTLQPEQKQALRQSLLRAIAACAPLRFTPGLASAIAGRPIAIRFILPASGGQN